VGAIFAVVAALSGLTHGAYVEYAGAQASEYDTHKLLGIATAIVALVAAVALPLRSRGRSVVWVTRGAAIASVVLVGVTAHLGGSLTHGIGFLTELLSQPPEPVDTARPQRSPGSVPEGVITRNEHESSETSEPPGVGDRSETPTPTSPAMLDFARDVQPIFS